MVQVLSWLLPNHLVKRTYTAGGTGSGVGLDVLDLWIPGLGALDLDFSLSSSSGLPSNSSCSRVLSLGSGGPTNDTIEVMHR